MQSFGDPRLFADEIRDAGALIICQCQNVDPVWDAIEIGADVIVAQGAEAGGHGALRGTLSFVPEIADLITTHSPNSLLVAAGGEVVRQFHDIDHVSHGDPSLGAAKPPSANGL